jgi:hypothetical protein
MGRRGSAPDSAVRLQAAPSRLGRATLHALSFVAPKAAPDQRRSPATWVAIPNLIEIH